MSKDVQTRFHEEWLGLAQPIEGLVFSVPVLADAQITPATGPELTIRFKDQLVQVPDPSGKNRTPVLDAPAWTKDVRKLFVEFLGYDTEGMLVDRADLPEDLHFYAEEGRQDIRPSFAIARGPFDSGSDDPFGDFGEASEETQTSDDEDASPFAALVWDVRDDADNAQGLSLDKPEDATGSWKYPPTAKLERLLRHTGIPIGLLSNGRELRVLYAPAAESTSHLTFRFRDMVEPAGRPVLAAFELLLSAQRMYRASNEHTLEGLLRESRRRQADVTKDLAAQVFEAVEILLEGFEQASFRDARGGIVDWLRPALEAPHDHLYQGVLSVILRLVFLLYAEDQGLLPVGHSTYAKHLSIQGLYDDLVEDAGMHPESMHHRFGAYGRLLSLFRAVFLGVKHDDLELPPRQGKLFDPSSFPFLEGGLPGSTAAITQPEARAQVRPPSVDDGVVYDVLRRLVLFEGQRLSYRALDVEQIGSVYESLMGYHVLRVSSPAVRLGKNRVWVETASLREMKASDRKKWLKEVCGLSTAQQKRVDAELKAHADDASLAEALGELAPGKKSERRRHRAPSGRLVLQPGEERRRSGSHYTPRSLTEQIVRRTLEPLLACLGEEPSEEQLLSLKICDPAMGSGAFLVETCRQLADQLVATWTREGRIAAIAEKHSDAHLHARRMVAQRCLYGVDKNDAAVELAKLSLWLVTMSDQLPFTFVDHALRHGDSLVGLDLEQVSSFHWKKTKQVPLFAEVLKDSLEQALAHRQEIHGLADCEDNVCQQEKRRLLDHAEYAIERIRLVADVCVGAFFAGDKDKSREAERARRQALVERWLTGDRGIESEVHGIAKQIREAHAPFHWWLEFPEVFYEQRADPLDSARVNGAAYMEAFVGNPPFAGKNSVAETSGAHYLDYLKETVPGDRGVRGNCDLCVYFFRRAAKLLGTHGTFGLIATNTIGQGDTRMLGLRHLIADESWTIYDATPSMAWPGAASVTVATVAGARGAPCAAARIEFQGTPADAINSRLRPRPEREEPVPLSKNDSFAFMGATTLGDGFMLQRDEAELLIRANNEASHVILPYVNGRELNSRFDGGHEAFVINFHDYSLNECKQRWPTVLSIVESRVRPERERMPATSSWNRDVRKRWWQLAAPRAEMFRQTAKLPRCLTAAQTSKHLCFSFSPSDRLFTAKVFVFRLPNWSAFATLQSRVHVAWAWLQGSTMKTDLSYVGEKCFATFPFPMEVPTLEIPELATGGRAFYEARSDYSRNTEQGLTSVYNALKDSDNRDAAVLELRRLTEAMDRAVLDAYGWTDIEVPPYCPKTPAEREAHQAFEDEVVDRLYVLNAERAREEQRLGLGKTKGKSKKKTTKKASKKKSSAKQASLLPEDS